MNTTTDQLEITSTKNKTTITVGSDLSIYSASQIFTELKQKIDFDKDIEIDLQKVEEIDTAGVQMLLILDKTLTHHQKTLVLTHTSAAVESILAMFNLGFHKNDTNHRVEI